MAKKKTVDLLVQTLASADVERMYGVAGRGNEIIDLAQINLFR